MPDQVPLERIDRATMRCLTDLMIASAQRKAHIRMRELAPATRSIREGFLGLVNDAFENSVELRLALVLDLHRDALGFWWILKSAESHLGLLPPPEIDLAKLRQISSGLKEIRDLTLVHLDKRAIDAPGTVKKLAGVTYVQIDWVLTAALTALDHIYQIRRHQNDWTQRGKSLSPLEYDCSDVEAVIRGQYPDWQPDK